MTPLIATLSCHNGSFGYFCQWFTVSVCHWYFSCLLVMFSPLPRWCFAAFLGWIITFWDDVSCHLGHSHHTPSPLPLRLPLDTLCCRHVFWQPDWEERETEGSWQRCQEDYKCPFHSSGSSVVHTHRACTSRWPSWHAGVICHRGG